MLTVVNIQPRPQLSGTRPITGRLGEGSISEIKPSAATITKLRADVNDAILAIDNSLGDVSVYAGLLSPGVLRAQPDAYLAIPDISEKLTPDELRTVIHDDAKVLGNIATRLWNGAAGNYITGDQAKSLQQLASKARGIMASIESVGPLKAVSDLALAQDHQDVIAGKAGDLMQAVEKDVVAAEARSVPVLEPYEKDSQTLKIVIGTGIAAAVIFGLWSLLSS
jgi:hypothetical protein